MKTQNLTIKAEGETTYYNSCNCNCGSDGQCVFKVHIKDGIVIAVEPDDRYNPGTGREDEVLSDNDLIKNRVQRRPCVRGMVFHKHLYHPDRVLYPLKRTPGSKRGEGKYTRISWDEALTTIAVKMKQVRERYGRYSVISNSPNSMAERLFSFWGAGVVGWGYSSIDAYRVATPLLIGEGGWETSGAASSSAADMLANSKIIVIWGYDPAMGSYGPGYQFAWYLNLARERGTKVIIFEPRYTPAAEVVADQWIPIKPGTDCAMFMAMAYVLFQDDLWDKKFVARFVEPEGFDKWKNYILGMDDGIKKSPEWAEGICSVPADTIRALVHNIVNTKPSYLFCGWGVSRRSRGENTVRAFAALQAMRGTWGTPGAGPVLGVIGPSNPIPLTAQLSASWDSKGDYIVPKLYRAHYWDEAVLLLDKVRSGELSEKDYIRMVGWRDDASILKDFNPKMLFWGGESQYGSNHLVSRCESPTHQVPAMEKMEFIVSMHSRVTPTARYADIILPAQDWMWEEKNIVKSRNGFASVNYCAGLAKPPGEVKPRIWALTKLADKLGIDPKKYFKYYTTDEAWDNDWERYQKDCYQNVVEYYQERSVKVPAWEEFTRGKFINCDELRGDKPFTGFDTQIREGKPFKTKSGKIEFFSNYVADEANRGKGKHYDALGQLYDHLASDWGSLTPIASYQDAVRGMDDPMVKKYPLLLLTPPGRYRVHSLFWNNPWLRDQVYQHRVWVNVADAKARGIKDGDVVKVYNDRGTVVMQAYVTARVMPGIIAIRSGGWYIPDKSGVDFGASASSLLGGDFESCVTPAKASNLAQLEKYEGELL